MYIEKARERGYACILRCSRTGPHGTSQNSTRPRWHAPKGLYIGTRASTQVPLRESSGAVYDLKKHGILDATGHGRTNQHIDEALRRPEESSEKPSNAVDTSEELNSGLGWSGKERRGDGRGDEDRRRIKERLREAVERTSGRGPELDVAGIEEKIFGICRSDFKRAKAGSRSDLPSPFPT